MNRAPIPAAALLILLAALLALGGCSRIKLVYNSADFILARYADDYLDLQGDQLERWEPRLTRAIATHRADELPYLAGFFADALETGRQGFPPRQTRCLVDATADLYRRQARVAVALAAPLLADLDPGQIAALEARFARDYAEDKPDLAGRDVQRERRKRANRYARAIEEWTGPLRKPQRALIAEVTAGMPETGDAVLAYRTEKRRQLIERLRAGADSPGIQRFLQDWLVEYRDLPPALEAARSQLADRLVELVSRLGASLDETQRARLEKRLADLRDDLLELQRRPRLESPGCRAV